MNPYEGLSLPRLMALLQDSLPPEPVSLWPLAPGWWIVLGWVLCLLLLRLWRALLLWRRNRYRREARVELQRLRKVAGGDTLLLNASLALLLKRTALAAYPRDRVAALSGEAWAEFLCRSARCDPLVVDAAPCLARAAYGRVGVRDLSAAAQRWIDVHRV